MHVATRSSTQARSHAQKFFVKLDKKGIQLTSYLRELDMEYLRERMHDNHEEAEDDCEGEILRRYLLEKVENVPQQNH